MDGAFWYTNRQWHKDFGNVRCCESTWRKNSKEGLLALSMTWLIVVVTMDLEGRVQIHWYVFCTAHEDVAAVYHYQTIMNITL